MSKQRNDLTSLSNTKDTTITIQMNQLLQLMHIHDSAFPIGSYTHSFGMETYIQQGKIHDKETLLTYCRSYLHGNLGTGDAIFVKEAWQSLAAVPGLTTLYELDSFCHAQKLAKESRIGSTKMGRQFLETVCPLSSSPLLPQWREDIKEKRTHGHHALSYTLYAYTEGMPLAVTICSFLYSSVANLIHNAVRAVPLGQTTGVQAIHAILPDCEQVTTQVLARTLDDVSNQAIGIELASMEHEFLFSRLFIS
ncbi:urease accessory protein UreF [Halalkalibacter oceani]|uniref:Urease accessory protein UreF n=1 Tax=Halalkalibacter oceani TaxID=1653776 RepID=A0A9X2DQZ9_9BACI|nr:urease accessory protein UreF [Halalkalibacter oceani]MCM3715349.1 urease accessory protein UreF [Halalkalibacter oceani]